VSLPRVAAPFLVLLALGACSYFQDAGETEASIIVPGNFSKGSGVIEAVGVLPNANRANARPGAKGRRADPNLYRLSIRMDGGGFQQVDVDNGTFMAGEAVELTNDGRVLRVTGTSLNRVLRR
jgi:hypothetical protein